MAGKDPKEHKEQKSSQGAILAAFEQAPKKSQTDLDKLSSDLHEVVLASFAKSNSTVGIKGSFNKVDFMTSSAIKKDGKGERGAKKEQNLAYSVPYGEEAEESKRRAAESRALMRRSRIRADSPFFLDHYYAGKRGLIAPRASEGTLFDYMEKKQPGVPMMRRLVAQLLLGIKELHDAGLVHRDIKPQNLLIFKGNDGKLYLKIADTESVAQINKNGQVSADTRKFRTKEYISKHADVDYYNSDLRKEDVYAFGVTLDQICGISDVEEFDELGKQTVKPNPVERPTVDEIMFHSVWGIGEKEQINFFQEIEKEAIDNAAKERAGTLAGKYRAKVNPAEDDVFNLMTPEQQDADFLLESLKIKDEFLAELYNKEGGFEDKNSKDKNSLNVYEIMAIKKNTDELLEATEKFIITLKSRKVPPLEVIKGLESKSHAIKSRMDQGFSVVAKKYIESGGGRELLLDAVRDAAHEFMSTKPAPDLKGESAQTFWEERQSAQTFLNICEAAFDDGMKEDELSSMIHQFIKARTDPREAPFNVLLEKNAKIAFETSNKLRELVLPESDEQSEDDDLSQNSSFSSAPVPL